MLLENEVIQLRHYILETNNNGLHEQYLHWLQKYENIKYINSISLLLNDDLNFIQNSFQRFTSKNAQGFFIYHKSSEKFIGTVKLDKIDFFWRSAEFGIMIGEHEYKGKKIGSLTMGLILEYAFSILGLNRVWGGTLETNIAMRALFLKYKFTNEGQLRKHAFVNGEYVDDILFGLLRDEWRKE